MTKKVDDVRTCIDTLGRSHAGIGELSSVVLLVIVAMPTQWGRFPNILIAKEIIKNWLLFRCVVAPTEVNRFFHPGRPRRMLIFICFGQIKESIGVVVHINTAYRCLRHNVNLILVKVRNKVIVICRIPKRWNQVDGTVSGDVLSLTPKHEVFGLGGPVVNRIFAESLDCQWRDRTAAEFIVDFIRKNHLGGLRIECAGIAILFVSIGRGCQTAMGDDHETCSSARVAQIAQSRLLYQGRLDRTVGGNKNLACLASAGHHDLHRVAPRYSFAARMGGEVIGNGNRTGIRIHKIEIRIGILLPIVHHDGILAIHIEQVVIGDLCVQNVIVVGIAVLIAQCLIQDRCIVGQCVAKTPVPGPHKNSGNRVIYHHLTVHGDLGYVDPT